MNNPKLFSQEIKVDNTIIKFYFEENGGNDSYWFKIYSKDGAFPPFRMEQNIMENPQEFIIIKRSNVPNKILKIEKELNKIIQTHRK